jgi:hypothetical protein
MPGVRCLHFMFKQEQEESYFKRLAGTLSALPRRYTVLLVCALILLIPFPTTVVPEWKVRVINPEGSPVAGVWVRQAWKHYSLELDAGENFDEQWSDGNGYVVFPRKMITKGLLHRAVLIALTGVMTLAHGSTGASASVWAVTEKCSSKFLDYKQSKPLPDVVVLRCAE